MLEVKPKRRGRRRSTGRPSAARKWLLSALFVVAAGLLLAGGVAVYRARPLTQAKQGQEVILVGQRMVRDSILGGRKAAFCSQDETVVEAFPDGKVRVSGWVDVTDPNGKTDRQNFSIVVYRKGNKWVGEALSVAPRIM